MKKTRSIFLNFLIVLCGAVVTTTAFGQTLTWLGTATDATNSNIGVTTNWSGGSPTTGTVGMFNGTVPGNLILTSSDGIDHGGASIGGSFGSSGFNLYLTSAQTGSVTVISSVANSILMGLNSIAVDSGAGSLILGGNEANQFLIALRPASSLHGWTNNSANPVIIKPSFQLWNGGGAAGHVINFQGTGDWWITNNLRFNNNAPVENLQWDSTGTTIWASGGNNSGSDNNKFNSGLGTIAINAGKVIITTPGLLPNTSGNNFVTNNALLKFDAPGKSDSIIRVFSGTGTLEVTNGAWTLTGANTYSGETRLSGGELVAGGGETVGISGPLGSNGVISFSGGTLGFSANNTYDYSPRFSTAANQAYSFDTAGQSVTFTNNLASSGGKLTKIGSGILTLSGTNSYSGATLISGGKLVFRGSKTGSGNIIITNGAALGITDTGTQVTPSVLTLGSALAALLEFNNVHSTTTAPLAAGTLSSAGTLTININSGTFAVGQSYPLLAWTSGSAPAVTLGTVVGAVGNLSTNGNTIQFNVTELALTWNGNIDNSWGTANNWLLAGSPATYADPLNVAFDDTATGTNNITISALVQPASVTVYNNNLSYSITSSSGVDIAGNASFIKGGNGTLTLSGGANAYTGVTTFGGGTVSVGALANGGSVSDIGSASSSAANIVFNGGTLRYTGAAASIDRLFSLGTGNGTIDASGSGVLALNNSGAIALPGSGARVLTLSGSSGDSNTLAAVIGDNSGATALMKSGSGKWVLTGTNTYSGLTTINNGTLQIGSGGAKGSLGGGNIVNNGRLVYNRTDIVTNNSIISGTGAVTNDGSGTLVLSGDHAYTGGTTINAGTLQVGIGGSTGSLDSSSPIADNGTIVFNSTGASVYNNAVSGTGNLIKRGSGLLKIIGANSYTGWTFIEAGSTLQPCDGNTGAFASSVVTNNGTFKLVRQDTGVFIYAGNIVGSGIVWRETPNNGNFGDITLTGTNTYTGGTIISGGALILGNGSTSGAGSIIGDVFFTNSPTIDTAKQLIFNRPDDYTFAGNITYSTNLPLGNRGVVIQNGGGTVTLTGNNTYPGGTTINAGILQAGAGGTTGSIGTGPVTDNSLLLFNRSDDIAFDNVISGSGSVMKMGSGALTLSNTNTYFGSMIISNGTLYINGLDLAASTYAYSGTLGGTGTISGPVTLDSATTVLAPGTAASPVGILTFNSDLNFMGNVVVNVDKSLAQSNDLAVVAGSLSNYGNGSVTVVNVGPSLSVGDKFTLFSQPVGNGAALTVTGSGATWQNNLATDGSVTVLTAPPAVNTNAPIMQVSVSGNTLSLGWPTNKGWTLQTNSVGLAATNQWFPYPGSSSLTNLTITINPAKSNVFFRMVYP